MLGPAIRCHDRVRVLDQAEDENRIERYALIGQPESLAFGEAETVLDELPHASWHGGRIAFGPDGMPYATVP